ncbi:hypothetical protein [Massilia sp. BJB1822]|uniref:hypothetical protein n=1 Tax=Massilia sp. BJB1822 TaxID=2744470 RepID=UPI001C3DDF5E|nr:hypothetical protein [Massilia sp. BJB1822]
MFYPYEQTLLQAVGEALSGEAGRRFAAQAAAVNKIQRLNEGREVNLYQMRGGKPDFDASLAFPTGEETKLASAVLAAPQGGRMRAEVWLVRGSLFSLEFSKAPANVLGAGWKEASPAVEEIKIWLDPLQAPQPEPPASRAVLSGWLAQWQALGRLTRSHAPLRPEDRMERLDWLDAALPVDYLALLDQTEGAQLGDWKVLGAAAIHTVELEDGVNYHLVAESEERGALAVRAGQRDGELYLLDYEDNTAEAVGGSLQQALERLLPPA